MVCKLCGEKNLAGDKFCARCGAKLPNGSKKNSVRTAVCVCVLLTAAVIAGVLLLPRCGQQDIGMQPTSQSDAVPVESAEEKTIPADETTTSAAATTTATTTTAASDPTQELRDLLVSKTWSARILTFDTTIKFSKDGTAQVKLSLLFTSTTVDGEYELGDNDQFTLTFAYGGKEYAAAGTIVESSESCVVVLVGSDKFTLTAED